MSWAEARSRSTTRTFAPSRARRRAVARPLPMVSPGVCPPPTRMATLPSTLPGISGSLQPVFDFAQVLPRVLEHTPEGTPHRPRLLAALGLPGEFVGRGCSYPLTSASAHVAGANRAKFRRRPASPSRRPEGRQACRASSERTPPPLRRCGGGAAQAESRRREGHRDRAVSSTMWSWTWPRRRRWVSTSALQSARSRARSRRVGRRCRASCHR